MRVTHICVVSELTPVSIGRVGVTAIKKVPVDGQVKVTRLGMWGDVQADRANHGGAEKAVYAMSSSEMAWWENELGIELPPGTWGENLRVEANVDDFIIGSRYRFGTAILEVTGCRNPCRTFEYYRDDPGWIKRFLAHGKSGTYFRVKDPGEASAGDSLEDLFVPSHGVSVGAWFRNKTDYFETLGKSHRAGEIELASYLTKHFPNHLKETL